MLNIFLLAAASLVLPAAPQAIAAGDVDGDGEAELIALMSFPERGSQAEISPYEEGVVEVKVVPSIEERRELWLFEYDGKELWRSGEPLEVGAELLAIQGHRADAPVVALTESGPALVVTMPNEECDRELELQLLANVTPLLSGANAEGIDFPFYRSWSAGSPGEVLVPNPRGFALVSTEGALRPIQAPLRQTEAGREGQLLIALPRVLDLDDDGSEDLLFVSGDPEDWRGAYAAFAKGNEEGRFGSSGTWLLESLTEESEPEKEKGDERALVDVLDLDHDGTLEAAVSVSPRDAESFREALRIVRGKPGHLLLYQLGHDGRVADSPEGRVDYEGHLWPLMQPGGWASPFRDIDGDGRAELMTLTIEFGAFGLARAVAAGTLRARIQPRLYALRDAKYAEVKGAVREATFKLDLSDFDLARFKDFPTDVNGDGALDMLDVNRRSVMITYASEGPRFAPEPSVELKLEDPIANDEGLVFLDLDGAGPLELVAIQPLDREEDAPSRPARLEIFQLGGAR